VRVRAMRRALMLTTKNLHPSQNDSTTALSKQSPTDSIEGTIPDCRSRWVNAHDTNWVPGRSGSRFHLVAGCPWPYRA
jgi:hypothetical protein